MFVTVFSLLKVRICTEKKSVDFAEIQYKSPKIEVNNSNYSR